MILAGINDTPEDADRLVAWLGDLRLRHNVNLIPMNPIDASELGPSSWATVDRFQQTLISQGIATFVRRRKGSDIAAACGQLALKGEKLRKGLRVVAPPG